MSKFNNPSEGQRLVWHERFSERDQYDVPQEPNIPTTFERVVSKVSDAELPELRAHWKQKFSYALNQGHFMPAGRILSNIGTRNNNGFNCYVLDVEDDLSAIFDTLKEMALIAQKGGGVGYNFSKLRPKGDYARSSASHSSGPCSFISAYNACSNVIMSGSRRAANMALLDIYHPDIEEFIDFKRFNPGVWERFNVSVIVDQSFMDKVNGDEEVELVFNRKVYKTLKAKDLWMKLCYAAHAYGDPGIIDLKYANEDFDYTLICGEPVIATNPCQPANATVLTPGGIRTIGDISVGSVIWSGKKWTKVTDKWSTGVKPVFRYITSNGEFIGTENHRVLENGIKIEVKNAKSLDTQNGLLHTVTTTLPIEKVVHRGYEEVFDLTVEDEEHTYWTGGVLVSNCSEKIMHRYDQCCLGSINLVGMIDNPLSDKPSFNTERFKDTIRTAVRFLDNIYDVTSYILPQNRAIGMKHRRVGLGLMGFADMCYLLGIKYSESEWTICKLMEQMVHDGFEASCDLAIEKGKNSIDPEKYIQSPFITRNLPSALIEKIRVNGMRNLNVLSIAPTGTISMLSGVSSGIEPVFSHSYWRKDALSEESREYFHPMYEVCKGKENFDELNALGVFETAHSLSPEQHMHIHGQFATYVDSNISKTCNLPKDATVNDVSRIFMMAREYGIKSTTVYREGSRNGVLTSKASEICPECGSETQTDANCKSCPACGWSVCSI